MKQRPVVYIASPYTQGDVAMNVHFQCKVFDQLLADGKVIPVAPLWSHFQHTLFPRSYEEWVSYDQSLLHLYDACLRLNVDVSALHYHQTESRGADSEVDAFRRLGRPVFFSLDDLYGWVDRGRIDE